MAVKRLIAKNKNVEYLIIGDGEDREKLEKLIHQFNLGSKIKLLGWRSQNEIIKILDSAHLFVLSSIRAARGAQEGISNALKEAMAMGLPVVSTYHSGTPELIENGVSGFLIPERDVNYLSDILEDLIDHPEIWVPIGIAARKKVIDEFESEVVNKKLGNILHNLLKNNSR